MSVAIGVPQRYCLPSPMDKASDDILVEIFSRIQLGLRSRYEPSFRNLYERFWSGRTHGWYRLAHVCRRWRRVVLTSAARLDLFLYFNERMLRVRRMITYFPSLPVLLVYEGMMSGLDEKSVRFALEKHPDRVRKLHLLYSVDKYNGLLTAMNSPFPILEDLKILADKGQYQLNLPKTFLRVSAPRLRLFEITCAALPILSPLLLSATSLVELSLERIDNIVSCLSPRVLLAHLQSMQQLRRLKMTLPPGYPKIDDSVFPHTPSSEIITLAGLTELELRGNREYLEELLSGLTPLPLRLLKISLYDLYDLHDKPGLSIVVGMSKFILGVLAEKQYPVAHAILPGHRFHFCMRGHSFNKDTHGYPPFEIRVITTTYPRSILMMQDTCDVLAMALAVAEKLVLMLPNDRKSEPCDIPWHSIFKPFRSVNKLRVDEDVVPDLAEFLQSGHASGVLPALEEIEVDVEGKNITDFDPSELAAAAQKQAGYAVKVNVVNTDYSNRLSQSPFIYVPCYVCTQVR
ncbi:hypothetical protein B0F90DRAFT_1771108 [Multifurca ochricompacta]|uniref:F-box domain-containing protein n=1 Tax=Multifurca ochricompacta TaxID=376703 RepID=A0AAD4LVH9_9AGAM|nr:hypothetical protein B0F90DRAFT_1771108 [Multifurca ochricompacta]